MTPMAMAMTAPLRSRWLVADTVLLTAPKPTVRAEPHPHPPHRRRRRGWFERVHAARGETGGAGRPVGPRARRPRARPRARAGLPAGPRHGLGPGPGAGLGRARPGVGAAAGRALGRGHRRARRGRPRHVAPEAPAGA